MVDLKQYLRMELDELRTFLGKDMRMSHVYQPLLIRILVDAGNQATVRQAAMAFAGIDEAQVRLYEYRIRKMPLKVLKKRGVVTSDGQVISLNTRLLTFEERAEIRALCEAKISEFIQRRGLDPFGSSLLDLSTIAEAVRYDVLRRDGGRCVLCGSSPRDGIRLEIDHIVPRSKGGASDFDNLQTLCAPCNRGKSNRDDTDFR